ncbi:MAG: asparagine synthase (glutamine-hydrolyzing) [Acidimicrobiales bacterium]
MCGLAGALGPDAPDRAQRAMQRLLHRGPDGSGMWSSGQVAMAHTRLAIIDPTPASSQPFQRDSLVVTYNGEIYNHLELKRQLAATGSRFETAGDTEVLVEVLLRMGTPGLSRLRGMFAAAIWDRSDSSLMLVRDSDGIKPLYWRTSGTVVEWASEARVLADDEPHLLRGRAVREFLRFGAPVSEPIFEHVNEVPPGSVVRFDRSGVTVRPFAATDSTSPDWDSAGVAGLDPVRTLGRSIAEHARSDRPVALFLSGGFDSAALLRGLRDAGVSPLGLTLATSDNREDVARAKRTAANYGIEHEIVEVDDTTIVDETNEFWQGLDQPGIDGFNTHLISRAAAQRGFPVALSGLGADEILGGYRYYRTEPAMGLAERVIGPIPPSLRKRAAAVASRLSGRPEARLAAAMGAKGVTERHMAFRTLFDAEEVTRLTGCAPSVSVRWDGSGDAAAGQFAALDTATYLRPTLLRDADIHSMRHGVELRVPFVDRHVKAAVGGRSRALTKAELARAWGDRFLEAKATEPKLTFRLPWNRWMPAILDAHKDLLLAPQPWRGLIDPVEADAILNHDRRGRGEPLRAWALLVLAAWIDQRQAAQTEPLDRSPGRTPKEVRA